MPNLLCKKKCTACQGGVPALQGEELAKLAQQLGGGWDVVNEHHLEKEFQFDTYQEALDYTYKLGVIAEEEGHHPELLLAWGKVRVTIYTHKVGGLTENDFILAAKYDECW